MSGHACSFSPSPGPDCRLGEYFGALFLLLWTDQDSVLQFIFSPLVVAVAGPCNIYQSMALMDKHKVKRQRLDRICEGEFKFFLTCKLDSLCMIMVRIYKIVIRIVVIKPLFKPLGSQLWIRFDCVTWLINMRHSWMVNKYVDVDSMTYFHGASASKTLLD